MIRKKDRGIASAPWILMVFFLTAFFMAVVFHESISSSAGYAVQDALASAALAAEVPDLDVLSERNEYVITDLTQARTSFIQSLKSTLNLDDELCAGENSPYFAEESTVQIKQLDLYNVSAGKVWKTDLLQSEGILEWTSGEGLKADTRLYEVGNLVSETDISSDNVPDEVLEQSVTMLDGTGKKIRNTSVYARIKVNLRSAYGHTVEGEKDILTDIVSHTE